MECSATIQRLGTTVPVLGRSREISTLLRHSRQGRSALVTGARGLGKTCILKCIQGELQGLGVTAVYARFERSAHEILVQLAHSLGLDPNGTSVRLRGTVPAALASSKAVILLDDIPETTIQQFRAVEPIFASATSVVGAAGSGYALGALRRVFWDRGTHVKLRTLRKQDAELLAESVLTLFAKGVRVDVLTVQRIIEAGKGNPRQIVEMCSRVFDASYRDENGRVRFGALIVDALARPR